MEWPKAFMLAAVMRDALLRAALLLRAVMLQKVFVFALIGIFVANQAALACTEDKMLQLVGQIEAPQGYDQVYGQHFPV